MRILVTGASGFIGTHLIDALARDAENIVFCLARKDGFKASGATTAITADLSRDGWTGALPPNIDTVIHLAQSRLYRSFPAGAGDMLKVNVDATFELLDWARREGACRFIHASSGSVYRPQSRRLDETDHLQTDSFYSSSKVAAEAICGAYSAFFPTVILRLFAVYGPGSTEGVIARLMRRVESGEAIELDGGIGMITTPTFIEDAVHAIIQCTRLATDSRATEILNICGDEEISLRDACVLLGELLQREVRLINNDRFPLHLAGTNARAKARLGWHPQWSIRAGFLQLRGAV